MGQSRSIRKRWAHVPGQMRPAQSESLVEPLQSNRAHRTPQTKADQTAPGQRRPAETIGIGRGGRSTKTVTSANRTGPKASPTWLFRLNQIGPSARANLPPASPESLDRRRLELDARR